ncbi:hypothetical protein N657DRAFT_637049 [Parathielavia appendiculata]|uniref:Uncharacterized protein n=1 Tax=Parathielavia appendiculata TaxID=2587402 RepID=A0AAN6TT90_9PEZI|nr:hypothetical protein N657DRAFT_637049 [Parathielavia appendiculata]
MVPLNRSQRLKRTVSLGATRNATKKFGGARRPGTLAASKMASPGNDTAEPWKDYPSSLENTDLSLEFMPGCVERLERVSSSGISKAIEVDGTGPMNGDDGKMAALSLHIVPHCTGNDNSRKNKFSITPDDLKRLLYDLQVSPFCRSPIDRDWNSSNDEARLSAWSRSSPRASTPPSCRRRDGEMFAYRPVMYVTILPGLDAILAIVGLVVCVLWMILSIIKQQDNPRRHSPQVCTVTAQNNSGANITRTAVRVTIRGGAVV